MTKLLQRASTRLCLGVSLSSLLALGCVAPALSADLRMALSSAPTSIDPHFHANGTNIGMTGQVFEGLTVKDENMQPHPALAESWEAIEDNVYRFHLREGVTFHDGSPFTAADVLFTFERVPSIKESPSPFTARLSDVVEARIVDDLTIDIETVAPSPNLMINLADIQIVSHIAGEGMTTQDYTTGGAMIGTGPYKFVSANIGEIYHFERNEEYWGDMAPWENLTQRIIGSDPARISALLAGDVDVIEAVPATDQATLEASPDISLWSTATNRVVFIALDVEHEVPIEGQAMDNDGNPLAQNPMLDIRVRKALSLAIDRVGLAERGLSNDVVPASQIVPAGIFGYNPDIELEPYDPEGARELLAEAGYPDGFQIVLATSNDDTVRARAAQAVSQMWTRIGVRTELEVMPHAVYIPATNNFEYAHMIHSWGTSTGEAAYTLRGIAGTRDLEGGRGTSNRGRYSNGEVDELVATAQGTLDDAEREKLLQQAMEIVIREDYGLLPLYSPKSTWASVNSVHYVPSVANITSATFASPAE